MESEKQFDVSGKCGGNTKNDKVLSVLLDRLEIEAAKEPMDTFNITTLVEAIKILRMH